MKCNEQAKKRSPNEGLQVYRKQKPSSQAVLSQSCSTPIKPGIARAEHRGMINVAGMSWKQSILPCPLPQCRSVACHMYV